MSANSHLQSIGAILQLAGIAAFAAGAVLSFHHTVIAVAFVGGAVSFFLGKARRGVRGCLRSLIMNGPKFRRSSSANHLQRLAMFRRSAIYII